MGLTEWYDLYISKLVADNNDKVSKAWEDLQQTLGWKDGDIWNII